MKRRLMVLAGCLLLAFALGSVAMAETLLSVSFADKNWDPAAWVIAKNPAVEHLGKWIQHDTYVENETPTDPAHKQDLDKTLTTMVYSKPFTGNYTVAATLEIGAGAAPGIILAQDWAPDTQGRPQYGEFYEAIIYEKGINLWHHFLRDGKPAHEKTFYANFPLKADTPYKFEVTRRGQSVQLAVDGHVIGVLLPLLPDQLYLGVEGCEGICRAYDFAVTR